jgi:hypothetical protein
MITQKAHTGSSNNIFVIGNFVDEEDVGEVYRLCKPSLTISTCRAPAPDTIGCNL